jgi:hypothetical protein
MGESTIYTSINIGEIVKKTNEIAKHFDCHWDQTLLLVAMMMLFKQFQIQNKNQIGFGGRNLNHRKKMKKTKSKKSLAKKTRRKNKKGAGSFETFLCFVVLVLSLPNGIFGLLPKKDDEVLARLQETYSVIDLFENRYGTCGTNTLLFLGNIGVKTHEQLINDKLMDQGMNYEKMAIYLNSRIDTSETWEVIQMPRILPENEKEKETLNTGYKLRGTKIIQQEKINKVIEAYIDLLKSKMMTLKDIYSKENSGIITVLGYPSYDTSHAVSLWLTSKNVLVVIDPQMYIVKNQIVLYTDKYDPENLENEQESLFEYFKKFLSVTSERPTKLLKVIHTEVSSSELDPNNPEIISIIEKLNEMKKYMEEDETNYLKDEL